MNNKKSVALGKLYTIEFPDDFSATHYLCEKRHKTTEDMQYHNHFEFGLCLEGQGIFFIGNKMLPFTQGNISIIPPGTPHFVRSVDSQPSLWMFVAVESSSVTIPDGITPGLTFDKGMEQILKLIAEELDTKKDDWRKALENLFSFLFILSGRRNENDVALFNYSSELSSIYSAIEYITQHYTEDIAVDALPALCGLSITHFRRKFVSVTGMTPLRYILAMRLRMASMLLETTNRKISDIALEVGFNTLSSFNRYFKEHYKLSPKDYRSQTRNLSTM